MTVKSYSYPVSVVRLIIPDRHGRVLILQRSGSQYSPGDWCLPGGKVDYGDTVEDACQRELMEETGLTCTLSEFLFYQDSLPTQAGGMHCINLYMKCHVEGNIRLNAESSQFAWIGPEDLDRYKIAFKNDEGLKRYWGDAIFAPPCERSQQP